VAEVTNPYIDELLLDGAIYSGVQSNSSNKGWVSIENNEGLLSRP
jgi:hypothetical protein